MTPKLKALGRRAVACKAWRWMCGMLCSWNPYGGACGQQVFPTQARVAELPMGPLSLMYCVVEPSAVYRGAVPDMSDPSTLGCLLALVREAWGHTELTRDDVSLPGAWRRDLAPWTCRVLRSCTLGDEWVRFDATSDDDVLGMAEALVAALEAAP